jgi:hypothetical protein
MLSNGTNSPGHAFTNVFAGTAHYPTVKKKGRHDNFPRTKDQFVIKRSWVKISKQGWFGSALPAKCGREPSLEPPTVGF